LPDLAEAALIRQAQEPQPAPKAFWLGRAGFMGLGGLLTAAGFWLARVF